MTQIPTPPAGPIGEERRLELSPREYASFLDSHGVDPSIRGSLLDMLQSSSDGAETEIQQAGPTTEEPLSGETPDLPDSQVDPRWLALRSLTIASLTRRSPDWREVEQFTSAPK